MWKTTQSLLALRKHEPALRSDHLELMESEGSILAFMRGADESWLLFVFNLGGDKANYRLPEHVEGVAPIAGEVHMVDTPEGTSLTLSPWTWGILRVS